MERNTPRNSRERAFPSGLVTEASSSRSQKQCQWKIGPESFQRRASSTTRTVSQFMFCSTLKNGKLSVLEIFKGNGSDVIEMPPPKTWCSSNSDNRNCCSLNCSVHSALIMFFATCDRSTPQFRTTPRTPRNPRSAPDPAGPDDAGPPAANAASAQRSKEDCRPTTAIVCLRSRRRTCLFEPAASIVRCPKNRD